MNKRQSIRRSPPRSDLRRNTSAESIKLAEVEREAIRLRTEGYSYDEIAQALGYANRGGAYKAVERGLQRWMREADDELRALELARLDVITKRLWPVIEGANPNTMLRAVEQYMRVSERRAKLAGLDAPEKRQVAVEANGTIRIEVIEELGEFLNLVDTVVAEEITKAATAALPAWRDPGADDDEDDEGDEGEEEMEEEIAEGEVVE